MEDYRQWVPEFVGRDDLSHNSDDRMAGVTTGDAMHVDGTVKEVGPGTGNEPVDAREVQGLHGNSKPNDNVFVMGINASDSKRRHRRRKAQRPTGFNGGPNMDQHKSPSFIRVRKRARSEVSPLELEDVSPNNWLSQLDLNIRPNSQDQDRSMILEDSISQVPDTMMDSSSISVIT
ncbi:hypothetical protein R6Q59_022009 [Mikania micrantha]